MPIFFLLCFLIFSTSISKEIEIVGVDFESSLGKNDPYMGDYYTNFVTALSDPDHGAFTFIRPHSPDTVLTLCKKTYNSYIFNQQKLGTPRIPHTIHQIWLGTKPFPEKYRQWQKSWQSIPGWTYKLWTDKDVEKLNLANKAIYDKENNYGARSDIARIEILYRFGGLYVDTDFELLQPEVLSFLNETCDFYCGITPLDCWSFIIENALIGSIPGHPVLKACIDSLKHEDLEQQIVGKGLGFFTKMILMHAHKGYRDVIFPPTFFYPLGYRQAQQIRASEKDPHRFEKIKKLVAKPESIAIHWFDGSWTTADGYVKKSQKL